MQEICSQKFCVQLLIRWLFVDSISMIFCYQLNKLQSFWFKLSLAQRYVSFFAKTLRWRCAAHLDQCEGSRLFAAVFFQSSPTRLCSTLKWSVWTLVLKRLREQSFWGVFCVHIIHTKLIFSLVSESYRNFSSLTLSLIYWNVFFSFEGLYRLIVTYLVRIL